MIIKLQKLKNNYKNKDSFYHLYDRKNTKTLCFAKFERRQGTL